MGFTGAPLGYQGPPDYWLLLMSRGSSCPGLSIQFSEQGDLPSLFPGCHWAHPPENPWSVQCSSEKPVLAPARSWEAEVASDITYSVFLLPKHRMFEQETILEALSTCPWEKWSSGPLSCPGLMMTCAP